MLDVFRRASKGWTAKILMGLQGVAALVTVGLVVARAVNILS